MKASTANRLRRLAARVQPAARVVERVAQIAVHLKRPTVLGTIGILGAAADSLGDWANQCNAPTRCGIPLPIDPAEFVDIVRERGCHITRFGTEDHPLFEFDGPVTGYVEPDGNVLIRAGSAVTYAKAIAWIADALDPRLPDAMKFSAVMSGGMSESPGPRQIRTTPISLSAVDSKQARAIWDATATILPAGPRCILLAGKPGIGKTTAAQAIARDARIGRTLILDSAHLTHSDGMADSAIADVLALCRPGVIIVDDIDKATHVALPRIEAVRRVAKLVILTANNGEHDDVLDGALVRPGRVDEVFELAPDVHERRAPFDRLEDHEWQEVSQWPVAFLLEVERRLLHRPGTPRLEDLRSRLARRTRSGSLLY